MDIPGGWELVLILVVVLVVFGSKRLPDSARSLGRSMRILKAETKGLRDDDAATPLDPTATPHTATPHTLPGTPPPPGSIRSAPLGPEQSQQRQP